MLTLCGYLICWHDAAELADGREQFEPGAFINGSARLVFGHDARPGAILGFGRVAQDRHGARFSVELDEHRRDVRQVVAAIRNGLNSCSFLFKPLASRTALAALPAALERRMVDFQDRFVRIFG